MIKHIVLWKLDASYTDAEKETIRNEFRQKLSGLKSKIPVIMNLEVYLNSGSAPDSNYDIMLDSIFNSFEDLNAYLLHPDHVKVVDYVKSLRLQRAAIDFQF